MNPERPRYLPGTLEALVRERQAQALACGALEPIATDFAILEEAGIPFILRVATQLERKRRAGQTRPPGFNPFLPVDEALWVADISDTHVGVLNKFNVLDAHLLIVTRAFEAQTAPLTAADWDALARGLQEMDGLAFYNGGAIAGASQRHKHLQLVPLPLGDRIRWPLEALLQRGDRLPFAGRYAPVDGRDAEAAQRAFVTMREATGPGPYNLLVTREHLLVVPRVQEHVAGVSINALGFAGAFFARNATERNAIHDLGPLQMLQLASGFKPDPDPPR